MFCTVPFDFVITNYLLPNKLLEPIQFQSNLICFKKTCQGFVNGALKTLRS